jgi:cation/acetate symporter
MSILTWTWILTGLSFLPVHLHRHTPPAPNRPATSTLPNSPYLPLLNGMATGADWMSAASFISMAGLISFMGRDGSFYLMGWTGGYVLLAMLFGPYLRKYGKFTIPQFMGDRYYSQHRPCTLH